MAGQVCAGAGIAASDMLGLTTALVDKSLVVVEPQVLGQARYRMLDTIREYAAARLADSGESERFQLALRDYVLRIAEESLMVGMAQVPVPWPERVACSLRYDADSPNVAQVLAWCLEHGDAEAGLRICVAVSPRWIVWGTFAEGGEWLDSFLALEMPALSPRVRDRPWSREPSSPCPAIPPRPGPSPEPGWSCAVRRAARSGPRRR